MTTKEDKLKFLYELKEIVEKQIPYNTNLIVLSELTQRHKVICDLIKDLDILETLKENGNIVIEGDNRFILIKIREYNYLHKPIDDFDKVKNIFEK